MVADAPPPAVLVVSDPRGYVHDSIATAARALVAIGHEDGLRVVVLDHARDLTPARLRRARAVVFLDTTGDPPLGAGGRARLLRFVRRGGGLVALHAATNGFERWPAWGGLIGARFVSHPPFGPATIAVTGDVTTRGVPSRFTVDDEVYVFDRDPAAASGAHVVARLADGDRRPLAWRRVEGRGRVFQDALGHPDAAWSEGDARRQLVRAGLRWATGDG